MTAGSQSAFADVNGVHMYYEACGEGEPLVLLHGGFGGVHVFGGQVSPFAERHRVILPEQRGRGHTADVDGPISYDILADDMIAFLEQTGAAPVHLVGVSDGGIVGLLVATRRPDLLRKLVTIGANFSGEGLASRCGRMRRPMTMHGPRCESDMPWSHQTVPNTFRSSSESFSRCGATDSRR